ncbi:MAG: anthranilate phosphoribosyltransferase [Candidatus Omnitrophica bacterium]|nr:anthranilate phosphoribosyltransferase [Candidatus Omnitrophota bacterium]
MKQAIQKIVEGVDLTEKQTRSVFTGIMTGKATPSQIGAFITALRMKGETVEEITGAAKAMRQKAVKIRVPGTVLDTCGTGGSAKHTFNVSTTAAFVLAACGVKVAKHGNRAASSKCGSADVLEELGVKITASKRVMERCLKKIDIGFLFAPLYHGAMKHALMPRREIGIRTVFNILGPLSNPAFANCQILGVYDRRLTDTMARVLKKLGTKSAYIVCGDDGLDEVSIADRTKISRLKDGKIRSFLVSPESFGIKRRPLSTIKGGTVKQNAKMVKDVLSGGKGPRRDIVLMNSSVALMAAGKVKSFKQGMRMAEEAIDSGRAMEKLEQLRRLAG